MLEKAFVGVTYMTTFSSIAFLTLVLLESLDSLRWCLEKFLPVQNCYFFPFLYSANITDRTTKETKSKRKENKGKVVPKVDTILMIMHAIFFTPKVTLCSSLRFGFFFPRKFSLRQKKINSFSK